MKATANCLIAMSASVALAACNGSDDASLDATADTVEMPADAALEGIDTQAVPDPAASLSTANVEAAQNEVEEAEPVADGINQSTDGIRNVAN